MRRSHPFPRSIDQEPTVRFAVRMWAAEKVIGAVVIGGIALALFIGAIVEGVKQAAEGPPKPLPPKLLILRENFIRQPPDGQDAPHVSWRKLMPPPEGFAYTRGTYRLVALPKGLKPAPAGFTYTETFHLVALPEHRRGGQGGTSTSGGAEPVSGVRAEAPAVRGDQPLDPD
jgi:hypothetical protein